MGEDEETTDEGATKKAGRLTTAINNLAVLHARQAEASETEAVDIRRQRNAEIARALLAPTVLYPLLFAAIVALGIAAGVASGTFDFGTFAEVAADAATDP